MDHTHHTHHTHHTFATIVDFLSSIGIAVQPGALSDDTFLPALRITGGGLVYDAQRLRWPGDLLHEAGHIAITPASQRAGLNDALDGHDAAPHAGEVEAIAWSWAALVHLGLPPELLFHPEGYKGQSAGLMRTYSMGIYPGAAGLARAGMSSADAASAAKGVTQYPAMHRWLR